jgi:competence protein ComEC
VRPARDLARRPLAAVRQHARHLLLGAATAGLLLHAASPVLVLLAAAAAVGVAGRPGLGLAAAVALLGGAHMAQQRVQAMDAGRLSAMHGEVVSARAVLLEPVRARGSFLAVARARLVGGPGAGEQAVLRVPSRGHRGAWPRVGEEVRVRGEVAPLGRWDAYQGRRGAHAALDADALRATGRRRGGLDGRLDTLRRRAEAGLARGLARPEAALLRGMVLGEDEQLGDRVRDDFQRSGLAHVLAVSGQNVMLLVALVFAVGAATGLPLRARLAAALVLVALYVPLAGAGPSIQRAGVMGAAGLVAAAAGRPASRWYALLLAAASTLVLNPRAAGEPGWQLSFAAVGALLVLGPPLRSVLERRLPPAVAEPAALTVAATAGTSPLLAVHFGQVSLAALPANLLAAPLVAPIMWLGMLAGAAAQLAPALAAPFTAVAAPLLVALESLAHAAAGLPLAAVPVTRGQLPLLAAAGATLAALTVAARRALGGHAVTASPSALSGLGSPGLVPMDGERLRRRTLAIAALACAALLALALRSATRAPAAPPPGELIVSFLDVGQGDATLLQHDGAAVLVDTGPPDGPILARLHTAGVRRLDALVLTHAQADHEGAAAAVIGAYRPGVVVDGGAGWDSTVQRRLPDLLRSVGGRAVAPAAGDVVAAGGMRLRVLWPPPAAPQWTPAGDPNERAIVALLEASGFRLLLTADAESDVTSRLDLPPVDALKVAHHGSEDAGLPALLARLRPRIAVIEVGRHNSYGHPAPSTLAALRVVPRVLRTDRDGTVRLHVRAGRMTLEAE